MSCVRLFAFAIVISLAGCDTGTTSSPDGGQDAGMLACTGQPDGTVCGAGRFCVGGVCVQSRCGDGVVDMPMEECDDGNDTAFDGCSACALDCTSDAMCNDDNACNGDETCGAQHFCLAGTAPAVGAGCTTSAGAAGVCFDQTCMPVGCGNMVVESGEDCDDGQNGDEADGCTDTCRFSCTADSDCDDENVCNGLDTCSAEHRCVVDTPPNCNDTDGCTVDACDPVAGCSNTLIDVDMDGQAPITGIAGCFGDDCDDNDDTRYTGATELCDAIDQDCDGDPRPAVTPVWFPDCDGDEYAPLEAVTLGVQNCTEPAASAGCAGGWTARRPMSADATSLDCNDGDAAVRPLVAELTGDGVDQNCDGDEVCYEDADSDNYRRPDGRTVASTDTDCADAGEALASEPATDCDDSSGAIFPSAAETPGDEVDQSCDGREVCYADGDMDTYRHASTTVMSLDPDCADSGEARTSASLDCNDGDASIRPGATETTGDEVDQNCDGGETCYRDTDNDDYRTSTTVASTDPDCSDTGEAPASVGLDCNDGSAAIHPGATEVTGDAVDQDCDGGEVCYRDMDGDMYRHASSTVASTDADCGDAQEALASAAVDCNDSNMAIRPNAMEIAGDQVDQNCDGQEICYIDGDGDAYRTNLTVMVTGTTCSGTMGLATATVPSGDCDDMDPMIHPGVAELPGDEVDQNCDGMELCYRNQDGDPNRIDTTINSPNLACTDSGEARASLPSGDCNDNNASVYPNASERPGDQIDSNCDGGEICYEDRDGDMHRSGMGTTRVSMDPDCTDSQEAPDTFPADDCNDTLPAVYGGAMEVIGDEVDEDCNGGEICYRDGDGDSYRTISVTITVTSADSDCGDPTEGRASLPATDCCDTDPSARPGQTSYFTTQRSGCGGYDYNCDTSSTLQYPSLYSFPVCSGTAPNCFAGGFGWVTTIPTCGTNGTYRMCSSTCGSMDISQTQACR